ESAESRLTGRRGVVSIASCAKCTCLAGRCGLIVASVWADSSAGQSAALTRQRSQVRPLFRLPRFCYDCIFGAVVQPGLGRQIVNLEVAGSNPVGPAILCVRRTTAWDDTSEKMRGGACHAVSFGSLRAPILPGTGLQDRPPDPVDLLHRVVDRDPLQVAVLPPSGGRGPAFPENLPAQRVST